MNLLALFIAFRRRKRLARQAAREEQRRTALLGQIAYRKHKSMSFRPHEGMLKNATCRALAASCGQEWTGRQV